MAQLETAAADVSAPVASNDPVDIFAAELKDFGFGDEPDEEETPEGEDDAAPEGEQPDDAAEADTDDEPETPAIEPPVSWKAEDKEVFAKLPPEAQAIIAKRESERDKAVQSKATEAAEARRNAALAEEAIGHMQTQYAANLQHFLASDMPAEPDEGLLNDDPVEYLRQDRQYRNALAQRAQAQQQIEAVASHQAQRATQAEQAERAEQARILAEHLPEWADPVAGPKLAADITAFATAHGYAPEQLNQAGATDVMFLHQAMGWKAKAEKFDKTMSEKMTAVRAAKELPKVTRPNAAQARVPAGDRREQAALNDLRTTGRTADPVALFEKYI